MTPMKNHTGQNHTYNMPSLQNATNESELGEVTTNTRTNVIKETHEQDNCLPKNTTCRKCEKYFETMEEIKKHMRNDQQVHTAWIHPCKSCQKLFRDPMHSHESYDQSQHKHRNVARQLQI